MTALLWLHHLLSPARNFPRCLRLRLRPPLPRSRAPGTPRPGLPAPGHRHALAGLVAAACLLPAWAEPPAGYPFADFDSGLKQAQAEGKPIFLYFGRYGCAWCDHTNKKTFSDTEIKHLYSAHYSLVYVDAEGGKRLRLPSGERITEAELGARLGAFATPLFVYMTPQGKVIAKIPGFKTVQDFKDYDRYVHGGHYERQSLLEFLGSMP